MKKNLLLDKIFIGFATVLLLCTCMFTSCKTPPVNEEEEEEIDLEEVHPLALLQTDASIYVSLPVKENKQLVTDVLLAEMPGMSKNDAATIVNQLDTIYGGLGTIKDRSRLEVAGTGDFPPFALKMVLTEKNGWTKESYEADSNAECKALKYPYKFKYYWRDDSDFQITFPSKRIVVVGEDLAPALEEYAIRPEMPDTEYARWITEDDGQVKFYITRPGQYLRQMIGAQINIATNSAYGWIEYVPNKKNPTAYSGTYSLNFFLTVTKKGQMKALVSGIKLAMGMLGGNVEQYNDSTIFISDMEVMEEDIINLFTRDPVTGKHFRVEGDSIIKE